MKKTNKIMKNANKSTYKFMLHLKAISNYGFGRIPVLLFNQMLEVKQILGTLTGS